MILRRFGEDGPRNAAQVSRFASIMLAAIALTSVVLAQTRGTVAPFIAGEGAAQVKVEITVPSCRTVMGIRVTAGGEAFFGNDQRQLVSVLPEIVRHILRTCRELVELQMIGIAGQKQVFQGVAREKNGWAVSDETGPLPAILRELSRQTGAFSSPYAFDNLMARYRGTLGQRDAQILAEKIQEQKLKVAEDYLPNLQREIDGIPSTAAGLAQLETRRSGTMAHVDKHYARLAPRYLAAFEGRAKQIQGVLLAPIREELSRAPVGWREAAATIALARKRETDSGRTLPNIRGLVVEIAAKVEAAVANELPKFKGELAGLANDWGGLNRLQQDRVKLAADAPTVPALQPYLTAIETRRAELLAHVENATLQDIESKGAGIDDLEAVVDFGTASAEKLRVAGGAEAADRVEAATAVRLIAVAELGYESFDRKVAALPETLDSRDELLGLANEYGALQMTIPPLARYGDRARTQAQTIETRLCAVAQEKFGDASALTRPVVVGEERLSLKDFVCRAALRGNTLVHQSNRSWFGGFGQKDLTVEVTSVEGDKTRIGLRLTDSDKGQAYVGYETRIEGQEPQSLASADWWQLAQSIARPRPTGVPGDAGVTECDRFAADPNDPKKRAEGIKEEELDDDAALDACIAAVEYRANDPTQLFQLGRVLHQTGNVDMGRPYLEAAAATGYAAAQARLADIFLEQEGQEKAALDSYKAAVAGGYVAAREPMAELAAILPIDFANAPPTTGEFKLSCFLEFSNHSADGELDGWCSYEIEATVNLDASTIKFSYDKILGMEGLPFLKQDQLYRLYNTERSWAVNAEDIGGMGGTREMSINRRTLEVAHGQRTFVGSSMGVPLTGRLNVSGECLQSF